MVCQTYRTSISISISFYLISRRFRWVFVYRKLTQFGLFTFLHTFRPMWGIFQAIALFENIINQWNSIPPNPWTFRLPLIYALPFRMSMLIVFEFSLFLFLFDMFYSTLQRIHRRLFAYVSIHLSNQPSTNFTMNHNIMLMGETELRTERRCTLRLQSDVLQSHNRNWNDNANK